MTSPLLEDLAKTSDVVGKLVAAIRPDQWDAPTPCTEWTVRDVVDHLVAVNLRVAAMLSEQPLPEPGADHLGGDPVAAYYASIESLRAAAPSSEVLERDYVSPLGRNTGAVSLQIRLADLITHAWDLAQATGLPSGIPDEIAEKSLAMSREQFSSRPRNEHFAEAQPLDADAPALDRLAAFLGRSVPWRP